MPLEGLQILFDVEEKISIVGFNLLLFDPLILIIAEDVPLAHVVGGVTVVMSRLRHSFVATHRE